MERGWKHLLILNIFVIKGLIFALNLVKKALKNLVRAKVFIIVVQPTHLALNHGIDFLKKDIVLLYYLLTYFSNL